MLASKYLSMIARDSRHLVGMPLSIAKTGVQVAGWTERQMLALLWSRLGSVAPATVAALPAVATVRSLDERMAALLERAVEQSPMSGRSALFSQLVDQLVPDEARILGALSDGSGSVLVHVGARGQAGNASLRNASLIGKTANTTLPHLTPTYVDHLRTLGLVEIGPEDPALKDDYQILLADSDVMRAINRKARGLVSPRVERLTLRLSDLGHEFWAACFPNWES